MSILNNNPYVIAEAGVNHDGEVLAALRLVDVAKVAGADCIKFQAFNAEELTTKNSPQAKYQKRYDKEKNQYDMLLKYELTEDDLREIKKYCDSRNIDFIVTPFSTRWVDILYDIGIKIFKISSGSVRSLDLLKKIGETRLPVILSTGMSTMDEIKKAVYILRKNGCKDLFILHCISLYPVKVEKINLFSMHLLKDKFSVKVGFSDHTKEIFTGELAIAAGAEIIEKHFTLDRSAKGPDHHMSLSPPELKDYIKKIRRAYIICGKRMKQPLKKELKMKKVIQTSLVAKKKIKKGEKILKEILTEKRPATGISPMEINMVIGRIVNRDIEIDEILNYEDFS